MSEPSSIPHSQPDPFDVPAVDVERVKNTVFKWLRIVHVLLLIQVFQDVAGQIFLHVLIRTDSFDYIEWVFDISGVIVAVIGCMLVALWFFISRIALRWRRVMIEQYGTPILPRLWTVKVTMILQLVMAGLSYS